MYDRGKNAFSFRSLRFVLHMPLEESILDGD
jgi:hypothetical protein